MTARLQALGTAMPERVYKQDEIVDSFFGRLPGWEPDWAEVFEASGVERRAAVIDVHAFYADQPGTAGRMRAFAPAARQLGAAAARRALDRAGSDAAAQVGDLVVVSCTGYAGPGLDVHLASDLGLGQGTRRLALGHMGCYAALPAIRTAAALVAASGQHALVVSVELCSLHLQPATSRQEAVSQALFGDGAAAALIAPETGRGGPGAAPGSPDPGSGAPGPAALRVQRRLRLSDAQLAPSREVLADGGNRSSATVLFILESLVGSGEVRPGQWLVTLGFGTGLTLEALLLRA